ncbi:potassium/proton antiporter regulatory subunit (CPA2 family) [Micromonospora sp. M71_S20]|uniref:cation:proton antiporter regulatory subunit n=1 Tax=Micromonospora sp. M71_S20 TaxID=592872 RepID=UPI000EB52A5C|nr:cation:proton antiporter regulatory subunit [Micromonospora sp. M71_S20]RLK25103.1 potassium/proton antiporter regulatory subunit (CPA2 family) [Micromonospora sp. M71_S20]
MDLERTRLFGVGESYGFTTAAGQRGAVIVHFDGRRDIVLYDPADPERVRHTLTLEGTEPRTIAELLGLPLVMDHLTELTPPLEGVETVRLPVPARSPFVGRRLGETRARTRTGASIVAVIRDDRVIPSPDPDFVFQSGDSLVVVGDGASLVKLREVFTDG